MIDEPLARGESPIHALDPRGRLLACLGLSLTAALAGSMAGPLAVLAVGLGLTVLSRPSWRVVGSRLVAVNAFVAFLWLVLPFSAPGEPFWRWGSLVATRQGVFLAGLITVKTNAIFLCILSLLATIPAPSLARAMSGLGVPGKFSFLFLFTYRYLHVIAEEYGRLATAAKLRGFVPATTAHTYRAYAALVAMVLVKSFDRSIRVYQAMLLRGFTGTFPSLVRFSAGRRDAVFATAMLLVLGGTVALEYWWGRGNG